MHTTWLKAVDWGNDVFFLGIFLLCTWHVGQFSHMVATSVWVYESGFEEFLISLHRLSVDECAKYL
jgi:hypothetical protein